MSDEIKIQTTAPDELSGGQQPLSADAEQKSRCGFTGSQVMRSFPVGVDVTPGTVGPVSPAPNNRESASVSGFAVAAPVAIHVQPVDRRTIEGSTPGDHRAKAADAKMPDNPAPRTSVGQANLNSKLSAASAPQSFTGNLSDSDAGN